MDSVKEVSETQPCLILIWVCCVVRAVWQIIQPVDADFQYVATQVSMLKGEDDRLQYQAAKELSNLSSDVPSTGISAGVLGTKHTVTPWLIPPQRTN